ncbi:hypothetical protein JT359_18845 [Candidatus Poribacteria bacterium]|nr:hypothetical protein [Candidatus Poribacteria bacterium]
MRIFISYILFSIIGLLGCQSKAIQMLFEPQEWDNLSIGKGVICSSLEMIDGDIKSVGFASGNRIDITLPTQKTIHKIRIRGTNISKAVVYHQLKGNKRWQALLEVKNNIGPDIEIRLGKVVQSLRIFVTGTQDDKRKAPQYSPRYGEILHRKALGKPYIHELELYGLKSKEIE